MWAIFVKPTTSGTLIFPIRSNDSWFISFALQFESIRLRIDWNYVDVLDLDKCCVHICYICKCTSINRYKMSSIDFNATLFISLYGHRTYFYAKLHAHRERVHSDYYYSVLELYILSVRFQDGTLFEFLREIFLLS